MELTQNEKSLALTKVAKKLNVNLESISRLLKDGSNEVLVDRFAELYKAEERAMKDLKRATRGSGVYVEARKAIERFLKKPKPELMHKAYGGKPQNFSEAFKSGKARSIHEAIALYTDSDKYVGEKISTWQSERNFLNQDTLLVKKARDYMKAIGLTIK